MGSFCILTEKTEAPTRGTATHTQGECRHTGKSEQDWWATVALPTPASWPWHCSALRQDRATVGAESMVHGISLCYFFQMRVSLRSSRNKKFHFKSSTAESPTEATLGHPEKATLCHGSADRRHSAHVSNMLHLVLSSHSTAAQQDQGEGEGSLGEEAGEDDVGRGVGRRWRRSRLPRAGRGGFWTCRCGGHFLSISQHSYSGVLQL